MRAIFDKGVAPKRDALVAICDDGCGDGGHVLVIKTSSGGCFVRWDDGSSGTRDSWDEFLLDHEPLKIYYPGDILSIQF